MGKENSVHFDRDSSPKTVEEMKDDYYDTTYQAIATIALEHGLPLLEVISTLEEIKGTMQDELFERNLDHPLVKHGYDSVQDGGIVLHENEAQTVHIRAIDETLGVRSSMTTRMGGIYQETDFQELKNLASH